MKYSIEAAGGSGLLLSNPLKSFQQNNTVSSDDLDKINYSS